MEGEDGVADDAVGGGGALAGAEVVDPGFHEEGFVEVGGVVGVAVDAPAEGAVAEADAAELVDALGEERRRTRGGCGSRRRCGRGLRGRRGRRGRGPRARNRMKWIDELRGRAFELVGVKSGMGPWRILNAGGEGEGDEQADGGDGEGGAGLRVLGDEAPEDGAEGHAALEGHHVGAEGAGGDPGGDGELDGGVERGHGAGPGGAGEDEHGDDDGGGRDERHDEQGEGLIEGAGGEDLVGGEAAADAGSWVAARTAPTPREPLRMP